MSKNSIRHPADLIRLWPNRLALSRSLGVANTTVCGWELRNRVPERYWPELVRVAAKDGIAEVTELTLRIAHENAKAMKAPRRNAAQPAHAA